MKKFFSKINFYVLIIIVAAIVILLNRSFGSELNVNLKELYQNNQFNKTNKGIVQLPLSSELPSLLQSKPQTTSEQDLLSKIKPKTLKTNNNDKSKILTNDSQASEKLSVLVLRCQDIKDQSLVFWLKENALYGEVPNRGTKIFIIVRDNCFWLWSLKNKNGLNVCSADIDSNFLNMDIDKINDSVLKQIKTKISNFNCSKEYVRESKFLPPANIEFFLITDENKNLF